MSRWIEVEVLSVMLRPVADSLIRSIQRLRVNTQAAS